MGDLAVTLLLLSIGCFGVAMLLHTVGILLLWISETDDE